LGFTLLAIIGVLSAGGYFVDRLLGTLPLFLLVGLVMGFVAGLYYIYQALEGLDGGWGNTGAGAPGKRRGYFPGRACCHSGRDDRQERG